MIRLLFAAVLGFALAYAWQHQPPVKPQPAPACAVPVNAPQLRDNLYWAPWPKEWKA